MNKILLISSLSLLSIGTASNAAAEGVSEGYYGSVKALRVFQQAGHMDNSLRPGIGRFVSGEENDNFYNSSIALGYEYGNGWRTELEYTFNKKSEYTSGSSVFTSSLNHHKIKAQRLMINAYRDYDLTHGFSVYGMGGLGVAKIKSSGWQGNESREYADNTDTNIVFSVGAGVSYSPVEKLNFDLGYRYVHLGKVESGMNNFANARGLQDEQMKATLSANEYYLGARYAF